MTSSLKFRISALLISSLFVSNSFAQQSDINNLQPVLSNGAYVKVYENVLTEFQKHFRSAENVKWYNINKDYLAKFSIGDLEQRALLDRKGNVIYKIIYGREKHLPTGIRKSIKGNYVEYVITAATLVEEANRSIWVVNLENESDYVIVRVENSELEEVRRYERRDK